MANIYVRSTDGSDADNGSTWALAKATLAGAAAIDAAGDTIFVSESHAELSGTAQSIALAGTLASPVRVICGDDAAEPPTAVAATGSISTTGGNAITIGGVGYLQGLTFISGDGATSQVFQIGNSDNSVLVFENCTLELGVTSAVARIALGSSTSGHETSIILKNTDVDLSNAGQVIRLGAARLEWNGGAFLATATPTALIQGGAGFGASYVLVDSVDFSAAGAGLGLVGFNSGRVYATFRNCKLPASWSGNLVTGITVGSRVEMHNCDSADTNYRMWIEDYFGAIYSETTIVRTGGANDGTTGLAWRMVSTSECEYPTLFLNSPEIVRWNETIASAITVTVEVVTDNVTLTNAECYLEVMYLGTAGVPLGSWISNAPADVLAAAANQTTSSETWTTTGLTTPVKQKFSVTFTPQEKGFIHARVVLAKASTTVYVDPMLTVT